MTSHPPYLGLCSQIPDGVLGVEARDDGRRKTGEASDRGDGERWAAACSLCAIVWIWCDGWCVYIRNHHLEITVPAEDLHMAEHGGTWRL